LLVKAEVLQRTGSFKFRGAYNRIGRLTEAERARGVIAYSSGNHAQGVAAAAALVGAKSLIVMYSDAAAIKVANTKALGGEVLFCDRETDNWEDVTARLAAERGLTPVTPCDDAHVIAGQGTVALELAAQAGEMGAVPDIVVVPCGGGGLTAGCALAAKAVLPNASVYGVEPMGFDDTAGSIAAGRRVSNGADAATICDALTVSIPAAMTFAINRRLVDGMLAVSDADVLAAMKRAFLNLKLVVEPGGAAALAAVLAGRIDVRGKTVAVICSGGNVDPAVFMRALQAGMVDGE
jgi:threonine dehydratase